MIKKSAIAFLIVFIIISFCACGERDKLDNNASLTEGYLMHEIGADSFADIEKCEVQCDCDTEHTDAEIKTADLGFLAEYKYTDDYPQDKVHELLLYPNNFLIITVNGENYRFRLLDDGSLVGVTSDIMCRTYQADAEHRLATEMFDKLHTK